MPDMITVEKSARAPIYAVVIVATAGTRVQCPITGQCREIWIQAAAANAGLIFVGTSTVTNAAGAAQGYSLYNGQVLGPLALENPGLLWVDASNNGDRVVFF